MTRKLKRILFVMGLGLVAMTSVARATDLTVWSFLDPDAEGVRPKVFKHVIDTFEKANPDIDVKVNVIQWQQIAPSLMRAAQARQTPDLVMLYSPFLGQQIAANTLMPLDDKLAKMGSAQKDLVTFPVAKGSDGKTYGVPWEMRVIGLIYRQDLLKKAGLERPDTLEQLFDQAKKLATDKLIGFGVGFNPAKPTAAMEWFIPTAIGMGASILTPDGKADFDSPQVRKLLGMIKKLVSDGKALPLNVALQGDEDIQQYGEAGRTLFLVKGTHRVELMRRKSGLGNKYSWMPFPGLAANKPTPAMLQGWNWAIPAAASHPDAAWKLMKYWVSPEIQAYQAEKAGYLPIRNSVGNNPDLSKGADAYVGRALSYASEHPLDFDWPEDTPFLYSTVSAMVEKTITGDMTIDQAINWGEKHYNQQQR